VNYLEVVTAQTASLEAKRALLQLRTWQLQVASDIFRAPGGDLQAAKWRIARTFPTLCAWASP